MAILFHCKIGNTVDILHRIKVFLLLLDNHIFIILHVGLGTIVDRRLVYDRKAFGRFFGHYTGPNNGQNVTA